MKMHQFEEKMDIDRVSEAVWRDSADPALKLCLIPPWRSVQFAGR